MPYDPEKFQQKIQQQNELEKAKNKRAMWCGAAIVIGGGLLAVGAGIYLEATDSPAENPLENLPASFPTE